MSRIESDHIIVFGFYLGGNAIFIAYVANKILPGIQVYAMDSFEGMPVANLDVDAHNEGDFSNFDYDELLRYVDKIGLKKLALMQRLF